MDLQVEIDDSQLKRKLAKLASPETRQSLNETIGANVLARLKDHLALMSVSRHKTADRLGAGHTRYFEDAAGRAILQSADTGGATILVKNTPGLYRAYHDLDIKPKGGKKWLTIPISRISYGKRVADLRGTGHRIFRPGKARILAEADGKGKSAKLRPLYALVAHTRVPKDEGLMPSSKQISGWMEETARDFFESLEALG